MGEVALETLLGKGAEETPGRGRVAWLAAMGWVGVYTGTPPKVEGAEKTAGRSEVLWLAGKGGHKDHPPPPRGRCRRDPRKGHGAGRGVCVGGWMCVCHRDTPPPWGKVQKRPQKGQGALACWKETGRQGHPHLKKPPPNLCQPKRAKAAGGVHTWGGWGGGGRKKI